MIPLLLQWVRRWRKENSRHVQPQTRDPVSKQDERRGLPPEVVFWLHMYLNMHVHTHYTHKHTFFLKASIKVTITQVRDRRSPHIPPSPSTATPPTCLRKVNKYSCSHGRDVVCHADDGIPPVTLKALGKTQGCFLRRGCEDWKTPNWKKRLEVGVTIKKLTEFAKTMWGGLKLQDL